MTAATKTAWLALDRIGLSRQRWHVRPILRRLERRLADFKVTELVKKTGR